MLGDALRFPIAGDDGVRSVVIGGVLSLLSFLILPILPLLGYYVRAAEAGALDRADAPAFDQWGDLLTDGVKLLVVAIGYFLIPALAFVVAILVIGIGGLATSSGPGPLPPTPPEVGLIGGLLLLGAVVLALAGVYVYPAGVVNLAREGTISAAFDADVVLRAAFSADYLVAGILAVVFALVVAVVTSLLTLVTLGLFALLGAFVQFYVQVAFFYLFGRGFGKAIGTQTDSRA